MFCDRLGLMAAIWMAVWSMTPTAAWATTGCPDSVVPPLALPTVKAALAVNAEVTVVAIGSSSTQGARATDIAHSYPAVLQAELSAALPSAHVAVLNRGVGGQDVAEMLPRLERDALNAQPTLVIWQVGANGALRRADPEVFRTMVETGVERLRKAGIDVVLMDSQRAPAIMGSPEHIRIAQALADIAAKTGAGLFGRGRLMDQWQQNGHPYGEFMSADGLHHNDKGYRCVAKALAGAILRGLGGASDGQVSASVNR